MGTHEYIEAPRVGIPINIAVAATIGLAVGVLGEGIEKEEGDFAAEVAAAAGS